MRTVLNDAYAFSNLFINAYVDDTQMSTFCYSNEYQHEYQQHVFFLFFCFFIKKIMHTGCNLKTA